LLNVHIDRGDLITVPIKRTYQYRVMISTPLPQEMSQLIP